MDNPSIEETAAPRVSVIVTTYNRVKLLAETLESILSQTFTDFELIVVDNMSVDDTQEFVSNLTDSRVRYFQNQNNGIIAVNRNFGIQQARGKYIAFCDDDDLWLPEKLKRQVSLMEQHTDLALCYTHAESFIGDKTLSVKMNRRDVHRHHFYQLLRGNFVPNSSVLVRRKVFQEIGLLTEDPSLREDYEMWLRIAKQYRLEGIKDSLIRYRLHPNNVAGNRAVETLRSIRTVRTIMNRMHVPIFIAWPNIGFQFLKYIYYRITALKPLQHPNRP